MSSPVSAQESKRTARDQFEKWALTYDRSLLNELVFFPAARACQEEIARWQGGRPAGIGVSRTEPAGFGAYRALDVGCGTGRLLSLLAGDRHAQLLVGLDYSPNMVRSVADKIEQFHLHDKLYAVNGDAERLPFADSSFDVITCCNSFHHYPHQAAAIREFHRVVSPGGILILIDGFRDNVIGWLIFDVVVTGIEKHVHHASWTEFREAILAAGFVEITQRKKNVLAPLLINVARR